MPGDRTARVPAVDHALQILSYVASQKRPIAAGMISEALGLPRSTTYTILGSLEHHGYVVHLREDHRFGLGLAAFELGSGFARHQPLARLGTSLLATLVDQVGESAHLGVLQGRDVVYVVEMRAKHRPALITDVGVRLPSDITASGLAMLSSLPPRQLRALFSGPASFSARSAAIAPYAELKRRLNVMREQGFGSEDEDVTPGLASVAVPVLDHVGWPAAAIAVTFERDRIPRAQWPALAETVRGFATELSRRIGRRDDESPHLS